MTRVSSPSCSSTDRCVGERGAVGRAVAAAPAPTSPRCATRARRSSAVWPRRLSDRPLKSAIRKLTSRAPSISRSAAAIASTARRAPRPRRASAGERRSSLRGRSIRPPCPASPLVTPSSARARERAEVAQRGDPDQEPFQALDRVARLVHPRPRERRPRQEEEPEHWHEPAVVGALEHPAEQPRRDEREARRDQREQEDEEPTARL